MILTIKTADLISRHGPEAESRVSRCDLPHPEPIFHDDADRQRFVETLAEACAKTGWQVHAYVLMPNHFHLVVETPQPNLVAGMKWFLGTYTSRFNRRHKLFGHLFSGRYKSLLVDGSGSGYLKSVCDYVHLNPARAKLVPAEQPLKSFAWSSWPAYLLAPSKRAAWLRVDRLLGESGIPKDSPAGRQRLEQALEGRRAAEEDEEFKLIRRGWCLGEETFRQDLLAQMGERMGAEHYGEERTETAETMAEQIIAEELKRQRWDEAAFMARPKGDVAKVALAERLRAETTRTVGWIAERLRMGTRGHLNHLLYRRRKSGVLSIIKN
ncbi:MAG: transposase [Verrucomicrobia bacterium]|nr:transposase [Verrucomicrobiota bacterium]